MKYLVSSKNLKLKIFIAGLVIIPILVFAFSLAQKEPKKTNVPFPSAKLEITKPATQDGELPVFRLNLNKKDSFSIIESAFAQTPQVEAELIYGKEKNYVKPVVEEKSEGLYEITVPEDIKAGMHTLKVTAKDNGQEQIFTQNFVWGVLALNPNKSAYSAGETANIAIAVLDQDGKMDCNAFVKLLISKPDGSKEELSTANGKIKVTPQCRLYTLSLEPDYKTSFKVDKTGEYKLDLTAKTKNGTHQIKDSIKVERNMSFDIERSAPTRIYPPLIYPVTLKIKATTDFSGVVTQGVPSEFTISKSKDAQVLPYSSVSDQSDYQIISWNLNIKKNQEVSLGFAFDSPDKSPDFYTFEPLIIKDSSDSMVWEEHRKWQIAIDAIARTQSVSGKLAVADTTISRTITAPASGSLIVAALSVDKSSGTITVPTDFTLVHDYVSANVSGALAYKVSNGTETTVAWTWVTSHLASSWVGVYTGTHGTPLDVSAEADSGASAVQSQTSGTTATTTVADEVAIMVVAVDSGENAEPNHTWSNSFSLVAWEGTGAVAGEPGLGSAEKFLSATGAVETTMTTTDTGDQMWAAVATFKIAASGISVSGNVYNAGTTNPLTACDANAGTNELSLRASGVTYNASCSNTDGSYTFTGVTAPSAGGGMVAWINDLSTDGAIAIRYDGTGDSTLNTFYNDTVTVTSDDTSGVTNTNMDTYDADTGDVDIPYVVTSNNITASSGAELLVKIKSGVANGSTVYAPGGTVTTNATGGDFHIDDNSAASIDTATSAIGRDILIDTGATLTVSASTTVGGGDITATGTLATSGTPTVTMRGTGSISGAGTKTIYNLVVGDGTTATTTLSGAATVTTDVTVGTGSTFNVNSDLTVNGGDFTNTTTGIINTTSGTPTVTISGTGNLGGGSGAITFYNLTTTGTGTTTFSGSGTNTVTNNVSVGAGTTLRLNSDISITGNLANTTSGIITTTAGTPTVTVSGSTIGGGTTGAITFHNLTKSGSGTTTFSSGGTNTINNNLSIGNGTFTQSDALTVTSDGSVSTGATYNINATLNVNGGALTTAGTGIINTTSGTPTVTISGTGDVGGGSGAITFHNLTTSGTGTTTAASDFTTNGALTVGASTTLAGGTKTLTVKGNFTESGTFTTSGTIVFNGSSTQTLDSTGSPGISFTNLTLSGGNTVKFTAGETFQVTGVFTVSGSTNIDSTTISQWFIDHEGTESVSAGTISNSGCDGTSTDITITSGTNGGGNGTCWIFPTSLSQPRIKGTTRVKGNTRIK